MMSLRAEILDLFNRVDPEGILDSTGVPDEYLPEVDALLEGVQTTPPQDADAVIWQLRSVLQEHFRTDGCPVGMFLPSDAPSDHEFMAQSPSEYRIKRCELPGFHSSATLRERLLGRMIWTVLQEPNRAILDQASREDEPRQPERPQQTSEGSSGDAQD